MKRPSKKKKNPKGGLTAAGRAAFRRKQGARLKPGVKKAERDMPRPRIAPRDRRSLLAKAFGCLPC